MYQNVYDKDPKRFYTLNLDLGEIDRSNSRIEQKGIREYLLCDTCEGKFAKWEDYAAETLYGKRHGNKTYISKSSATPDKNYFFYDYSGFDYITFKLFLLSILWRLFISNSFHTPEIHEDILERLRVAVLNEDPLDFDDFGCLVQVLFYKEGIIAGKFILQPYMTGRNQDILNIAVDGFMFSFYLNSKDITVEQKEVFVNQNGKMQILGRVIFNDEGLMHQLKAMQNFYIDNFNDDQG